MFSAPIRNGFQIRLLEERHAAEVFAAVERNREHLRPWLPWVDMTSKEDDTRAFIKASLQQFAANEGLAAGIWSPTRFAGGIGTHKIDWLNRRGSIGYWLSQEFVGQGIMTDACRCLITHLFHELGLNRVEIHCAVGNDKSAGVPRRLGFTLDGVLRQAHFVNGRFHNLNVFGMLKSEWPA